MRFSGKGIGWLIFGLIVCMSSTEADDIPGVASSIALGLVFIAIYLMKQRFQPRGIGWFIGGGILLAFTLDELLSLMSGFISTLSILPGDLTDMFIGGIAATGCLYMFYKRNREDLNDYADGIGMEEDIQFPYHEEVFRETVVEEAAQVVTPESADAETDEDGSVVEIEVLNSRE